MKLPNTLSYKLIEEAIKPFGYSVRVTAEPLLLHRHGKPVKRFQGKRDLCDYLNFHITRMEQQHETA